MEAVNAGGAANETKSPTLVTVRHPHTGDTQKAEIDSMELVRLMVMGYSQIHEEV